MFNTDERRARILIIDDEPSIRGMLTELLGESYECAAAGSAEEALDILRTEQFQLVISDIMMPGVSGLDMVPRVKALAPDTVIIMMSGAQTVESAIEALRVGAFDYIMKPFDLRHVEAAVRRALDHHGLREAKRRHESYLEELIKQRTAELDHVSNHDILTGLPNRVLFEDRLTQALALARDDKHSLALMFLDIDRFKKINESLGYQAGDSLLRELTERLRGCVGEPITLARFGGDEFTLLAPRVGDAVDAIALADRMREAFTPPFMAGGHEIYLTASVGISLYPFDGEDAHTLLRNAGAALHRAREQGGGHHEFYTAVMNTEALRRLSLESSLRRALEREEFVVHYQPQYYRSETGAGGMRISGAEALVRWQHPELGLVSPAEFIPLAESTGLIVPLGEWVLRTAYVQNKAWQLAGFPPLRLAVNLSACQFHHHDLSESVARILNEAELDPDFLELELTESSLMRDAGLAIKTSSELRGMGVKISVDDFGTGYSSLSYLIDLPIDALKIDRSFVCEATTNLKRAKLLRGIVQLAHDLNLKVKAEGVETEDQRNMLCQLGCDEMQGYLFSRPVPAREFEQLLLQERNVPRHKIAS